MGSLRRSAAVLPLLLGLLLLFCPAGEAAAKPVITITGGNPVTEGENARFTLTLNPAPRGVLKVNISVTDDGDYLKRMTQPYNTSAFPVLVDRKGSAVFVVPTVNNASKTRDGSLKATVESGAGYTVGAAASAKVTVRDKDGATNATQPPGLKFSTTHLTWNESQDCGELEYYGPDGNKITGSTPQERRKNALAANAPWQTGMHSTPGASMELPNTAPGPTYQVKLKSQPMVPVKVTVYDPNDLIWWGNNTHRTLNRVFVGPDRRASNGRNSVAKPTLTFTRDNWDTYQTVKVKVACTDHFPDAIPLEHRMVTTSLQHGVTRFAYPNHRGVDDKRWTVWVRVNEQTPPVEIVASGLPPAGDTITLEEGETRDFKIRIGERMLPNGSDGRVSVHLYTEPIGNVLRATRRDGQPLVDGVLMDTMTFTNSSREQWVRLEAVGAGDTRLVVSAERDFTWAHDTRRHWSPEWPVTVELPGICGRTKAVRDEIVRMIPGVRHCRDVTDTQLAAISGDVHSNPLNLYNKGLSSLKAGDFDGLTNLKRLRMDRNSLTTLPAGIFDDLAGLMTLDLDRNQLTTLRSGVFDSLTNLRVLYLNDNSLAVLPDGVFKNNLALATHWLEDNPGVPFTPTANAGTDQTVAAGAKVTLSGTATGPWAESDTAWHWRQVDGPYSDTVVQGGVQRDGQTATFTAPAAPTVMHFRLAAIPKVLIETRPNSSGGTSTTSRRRGILDGFAWVTITVGGGQGSPQEDAQPAQVEEAACVSDALLAEVRAAAGETWRSPGHVERWSRVLAAFGVNNAYSNNPMTVAEARAQADRGLKRWAPVAPALECLAAAPEEQPEQAEVQPVTPATPELSLSAGSAVDEGGNATFTVTADPAPQSDLTIAWTVAQSGDYLATPGAGSRTVTLAAGTASTDLSVATVDDAADEADGSVSVTLGTGTGYTVATGKGSAAVAVRDNDEPVVSIAAGSGVTEGAAASFTVSASPVPAAPLDVTLTVGQSGDFAASGETGSRTVTVPVSGSVDMEVATVDDGVDEPDGSITASVDAGTGYTVAAAPDNAATVAVADNDATSSGPTISIADATMKENQRNGYFKVTLSEKVAWPVHVYYATRDSTPVSAVAGQDYLAWQRSWRLRARFRPGETETQIHVPLYNDSHDEDPETFEMVLFDAGVNGPPGVSVSIADGVAVGTIVNDDPIPAAWLARFGRAVAEHALRDISDRIAAPRIAGVEGVLAGQALGGPNGGASPAFTGPDRFDWRFHEGFGGSGPAGWGQVMSLRDVMLSSSFTATGAVDMTGGSMGFWGRASEGGFDGMEGRVSLSGDTMTALLGADYARGPWLLGMALAESEGKSSYADTSPPDAAAFGVPTGVPGGLGGLSVRAGDGEVEGRLTAAIPYLALQASERVRLWSAMGQGSGAVTVTPALGGRFEAATSWTMMAAGLRGDLLAPDGHRGTGPALALTSDALWVRTSSEKTRDLAASESDVSRLRLGLEGSWAAALGGDASLTPKLELGARHDGGDAETGFGVELGTGLAWADPALGLTFDLSARTLLTHDAEGRGDRGVAAQFAFDPDGASARGLSLGLTQDWGGQAAGGLDALFADAPLEDRTGSGSSMAESRWVAEAAYGLPVLGGRFTGSPHIGLGLATGARDYTLGWRLTPTIDAPDLSFGVRALRRESDLTAPEHAVGFEATARW